MDPGVRREDGIYFIDTDESSVGSQIIFGRVLNSNFFRFMQPKSADERSYMQPKVAA
jgi:hypothetical protein